MVASNLAFDVKIPKSSRLQNPDRFCGKKSKEIKKGDERCGLHLKMPDYQLAGTRFEWDGSNRPGCITSSFFKKQSLPQPLYTKLERD